MLDHVSISHESGLVLWSRSFNPIFLSLSRTSSSPINHLVKDVIIENKAIVTRGEEEGIEKDGFSVRWTVENGLGLVFVIVFPALLPLTYIPAFLARLKALFLAMFQPYLTALVNSLSSSTALLSQPGHSALQSLQGQIDLQRWEAIFDRCLKSFESASGGRKTFKHSTSQSKLSNSTASPMWRRAQMNASHGANSSASEGGGSSGDDGPALSAEEIAKNVKAMTIKGKAGKGGSNGAKGGRGGVGKGSSASPLSSPSRSGKSSATAKIMRKWADGNTPVDEVDMASLDYSTPDPGLNSDDPNSPGTSVPGTPAFVDVDALVNNEAQGTMKGDLYEVADWDKGRDAGAGANDLPSEEEILARGNGKPTGGLGEGSTSVDPLAEEEPKGALASLFSRFTGNKILTTEDLRPILAEMEKHLMSKNVAMDISVKLCENVGAALVGKKLAGFGSVRAEVNSALSSAITRILTSKTSTDILLDIKRKASLPVPASLAGETAREPYIMTFVGVNGVGKSTNLSKVCFWLLQNRLRVLIAACDTFRSGAVEQLRVHVRNLSMLDGGGAEPGDPLRPKNVELYERGYGKDAAGIAKDAIAYARENRFDVVLVDTAGRMQDNEPLMRALAKLVSVNNPDKIVFVGEALVGNEAVDQLSKFDRSLKDFSAGSSNGSGGKSRARGIDGMILTKFDTIDDKVGAALSMTYITGQPILFVGCGQTYTDLRHLRVNHIVRALLSD